MDEYEYKNICNQKIVLTYINNICEKRFFKKMDLDILYNGVGTVYEYNNCVRSFLQYYKNNCIK